MKNKTLLLTGLFTLCNGYSSVTAQSLQTNDLLNDTLKKVDTDGEYLQAVYVKKDIAKLLSYAEDLKKAVIASDPKFEVGENLEITELLTDLGIADYVSTARSDKRVYPIWINKLYTNTGGKFNGINSIYGGVNEKFSVTDFAPASSDLALQMRLDLRQLPAFIEKAATQLGKTNELEAIFKAENPNLAGMTPMDILAKINLRVNLVVDFDEKAQLPLPIGSVATPNIVARIDNASWAWALIEGPLIESSGLPWKKQVKGDVTLLTLPEELKEKFMGFLPVISVDKKHIWLASSEAFLNKALDEKGDKLKDNRAFQRTLKNLPESGNYLAYMSEDFQSEIVKIYKNNEDKLLAANKEFAIFQPLINEMIEDVTSSGTAMAAVIDVDETGILAATSSPFTLKNYISKFISALSNASSLISNSLLFKDNL